MKIKLYLACLLLASCENTVSANEIYQAGDAIIELSEKTPSDEWRKATYKNKNYSFVFPSDDPTMSFWASESKFSKNRQYFILATAHDNSNGQDCYLLEMQSGCVIYRDYCSASWEDAEDAAVTIYNTDTMNSDLKQVSDFDRRLAPKMTMEDYEYLRAVNGEGLVDINKEYMERVCGVTVDSSNNVKYIRATPASSSPKKTTNFQEILKACKTQCNKGDLENIDTQSIVNVTKGQVATINDIAFYMDKNGLYKGAIDLLNKVIAADPNRTPAYLNIADALWNNNQKVEANKNYAIYTQKMKDSGKESKIPERVGVRLKAK